MGYLDKGYVKHSIYLEPDLSDQLGMYKARGIEISSIISTALEKHFEDVVRRGKPVVTVNVKGQKNGKDKKSNNRS